MLRVASPKLLLFLFLAQPFLGRSQIRFSPKESSPRGEIEHYSDFSLNYSESNEQPFWVAYELTQKELMVKRSRTNHFKADRNISTGSAALSDYKNSGFDRGHLVRASFCKTTSQGYKETYYLSNMSPQLASINRIGKIWYRLEDAEMYFAYALDKVFSTSGPIFKDNLKTIGRNKVTVPGHYYKVILSQKLDQAIGFIIPHKPSSKNIFDFAVTVDEVERETGIDFFHQLSGAKERKIESNLDKDFWRKQYQLGKKEKRNPEEFNANVGVIDPPSDNQSDNIRSDGLKVISWNVESGGAHPDTVALGISEIVNQYGKIDIWGLSEVRNSEWARTFRSTMGESYWFQLGTTGRSDRLAIIYDRVKFEQIGTLMEFHDMNPGGRVRAPIALQLKDKKSGQEFIFMVNHLYRGNAQGRQQQARALRRWVQTIDIPVIATGDYNFDFDIPSREGNTAFEIFIDDEHFEWIEPKELVRTQCNMNFNSVLDFIFVNDDAAIWDNSQSEIIVQEEDCEDSDFKPDHRPVYAHVK